jgi:hypothetical protein
LATLGQVLHIDTWGDISNVKKQSLAPQMTRDMVATPINARMPKEEFKERVTFVEIEKAGHALLPGQPE